MTAAAPPVSENRQPAGQVAAVPWRRMMRVTTRQHRMALLSTGVVVAVLAVTLAATGISLHALAARGGPNWYGRTRGSVDYGGALQWLELILQLLPLLAGMFLGAPLLPREIDSGTSKLAWTQAASRTRWLLAQLLPIATVLAVAALGLGAVFAWWRAPFPNYDFRPIRPWSSWSPWLFNLNPVLLAGWVVFAFILGVVVGAAIRRTLPAMAATFACYGALVYAVSTSWRMHYLPPLHRVLAVQFQGGTGSYSSYSYYGFGSLRAPRPVIVSDGLAWPDGRLLSNVQQLNSAAWMRAHHIVEWVTYQPASRYHAFQAIEIGWLLVVSALLLAGAIVLIRRRPA